MHITIQSSCFGFHKGPLSPDFPQLPVNKFEGFFLDFFFGNLSSQLLKSTDEYSSLGAELKLE